MVKRARREFVQRFCNRAVARQTWGERVDTYARYYEMGDPLADAVVEEFERIGRGRGHRMLLRALDDGIGAVPEAPDALRALFEQIEAVPVWADFGRMDRGARAYQRAGSAVGLVLSAFALMNGYRCGPAVKPLVFTKQLEEMAPRRLAETGRYVIETIQAGGMRRDAEGFKIAVRVRMMHAMVRRMILQSGRWNREAWGMPINQADMAGTILEFSLLFLWGARMMGFRFRKDESEAIMHLWRYSGYLSGVDAGLSCATEDEAFEIAHMANSILAPADEDSVALAQALRGAVIHGAKTPLQKRIAPFLLKYHDGLTRAFNGDEVSDALRIPNRWWKLAIWPTRAVVTPFELLRPYVPGGNRIASFLGNQVLRVGVQTQLEGVEPDFHPGDKVHGAPRRRRFAAEPAAV